MKSTVLDPLFLMKIPSPKFLAAALLISSAAPVFAEPGWTTDYAKAVEQARTDDKAILLDFTGSDWCPWCMKMKKEALDTPMFKQYAERNLVLVEVDFPHNKTQSGKVIAQNQNLSQKYHASAFPTFVIVSKTGTELGRQEGYLEGGPKAFIAELKKFYKGSPGAGADSAGAGSGLTGLGGTAASDDFESLLHKPAQNPTP
jgi:thioredoxin-related protein